MPRELPELDPQTVTIADLAEAVNEALAFAVSALDRATVAAKAVGPIGPAGVDGKPGERGGDGVGLAAAAVNEAGHLVLTLTDGRSLALGAVRGERGQDGAQGGPGPAGPQGPAGPPGESIRGERGPEGPPGRDADERKIDDLLTGMAAMTARVDALVLATRTTDDAGFADRVRSLLEQP